MLDGIFADGLDFGAGGLECFVGGFDSGWKRNRLGETRLHFGDRSCFVGLMDERGFVQF